jgi:hypothetical protein
MRKKLFNFIGLGAIAAAALVASASGANAKSSASFSLSLVAVNAASTEQCFEGLCVNIVVNRVRVNGDRAEICAYLVNGSGSAWTGGMRLTSWNDPATHNSLSVGAGMTKRHCEILPTTNRYWVVLRQD